MDYNEHKYWAEGSDLTEVEKIQMAKDLRELESRGVIQFRDGRWELAAGVEIAETRWCLVLGRRKRGREPLAPPSAFFRKDWRNGR
jgi:hypothetical protein